MWDTYFMGTLELEFKKRRKKENIQKIILGSIAVAAVLPVAAVAGNALQILKMFDKSDRKLSLYHQNVNRSFNRLLDNGLIEIKKKNNKKCVALTPKGQLKLRQLENYNFKIKKPRHWDGKWRIIIFDIKIGRNNIRNKLRLTLQSIGFLKLQNSVWVYPYDCEDLVTLLKADFKVGKEVLYIIADTIENDNLIKKNFRIA
jgi:CRISPR-associated endonuclease Cas2